MTSFSGQGGPTVDGRELIVIDIGHDPNERRRRRTDRVRNRRISVRHQPERVSAFS